MIRLARQEPVRITRKPTLEMIPIFAIRPNPYQPRKYFSDEAIADLADSIRQIGLLQPINVRRAGEGGYELIAGERRLRACKLAGLTEIKAIILDSAYDRDIAMIAMIENLQRENLHFFEEAEGYQSLIREHGFTQEELATRLAKNQSTVANKLRILKLPASKRKNHRRRADRTPRPGASAAAQRRGAAAAFGARLRARAIRQGDGGAGGKGAAASLRRGEGEQPHPDAL